MVALTLVSGGEKKPDLVLKNLTWKSISSKTSNIIQGSQIVFCAEVLNDGNGSTPSGVPITATFIIDGKRVSWSDSSKTSLKPGQTRMLWANDGPKKKNFWIASSGQYNLTVIFDDLFKIDESDEDNNTETIDLDFNQIP